MLPIGLLPLIRTYMILHIHDTLRLEDYYFCYFYAKYQIIVDNAIRGKLVEIIVAASI